MEVCIKDSSRVLSSTRAKSCISEGKTILLPILTIWIKTSTCSTPARSSFQELQQAQLQHTCGETMSTTKRLTNLQCSFFQTVGFSCLTSLTHGPTKPWLTTLQACYSLSFKRPNCQLHNVLKSTIIWRNASRSEIFMTFYFRRLWSFNQLMTPGDWNKFLVWDA